jgi:hypothetical protein
VGASRAAVLERSRRFLSSYRHRVIIRWRLQLERLVDRAGYQTATIDLSSNTLSLFT